MAVLVIWDVDVASVLCGMGSHVLRAAGWQYATIQATASQVLGSGWRS